jgi:hypothetical protein
MANPSEFLGGTSGPSPTSAPGGGLGMATGKPDDPSELLYKGENVLGKATQVETPGTVAAPLSAGIASTPTPGSVPGAGGEVMGGGVMGEQPGPTTLQLVQQALGITEKSTSLGQRLSSMLNPGEFSGLAGSLGPVAPGAQPEPSFLTDFLGSLEEGAVPAATSGADAAGLAEGGAAAAGSTAGGLSAGGGAAALVAAILGLIASQTGNQDLGKAAQGLGAAGSAAATGGSIASGIAAPAAAGIGTAAGAAFSPIAAALIASTISGLAGKGDPIGEGINEMILQGGNDYQTFNQELGQNVGQQHTAYNAVQQAFPYVQNKAELGQLLNTYKNYLGTTTGIPMEDQGGVYKIGNIPDVGPRTHGQPTQEQNWGPMTAQMQQAIDALYGVLPGEPITADYAGGGGLSGEAANRLWNAFVQNPSSVPTQLSQLGAMGPEELAQQQVPLYGGQSVGGLDLMNAQAAGTIGRQPVYDPATGQYVFVQGGKGPGTHAETFQQAPYWAQILGQGAGGAPAGGGGGVVGTEIDELIRQAAARQ